jgi:hypothetical protein
MIQSEQDLRKKIKNKKVKQRKNTHSQARDAES